MNIQIKFENGQEYFRMCGPWLADCYLGNRKLKHKFLADNYTISGDDNYLVLNRYHIPADCENDNPIGFNILVVDLKTKTVYISNEIYESLFIESMKGGDISVFRAFHDSDVEYRESLEFSDQTFSILEDRHFYESIIK